MLSGAILLARLASPSLRSTGQQTATSRAGFEQRRAAIIAAGSSPLGLEVTRRHPLAGLLRRGAQADDEPGAELRAYRA
jgi:hypothetical protein